MHRACVSRSVAVLVTMLFAFQLLVVGSGMACIMPGAAMAGDMGRTAAGAVMKGNHSMPVVSATPAHAADASHQMPCDQRTNPPLCQAMGPCLTAIVATPVAAPVGQHIIPSRIAAMVVLTPPSQTFPPELPPPRA